MNKKLRLFVIIALVIQILLPAGLLGYHYHIYNYALNNTPDFKFYLSYFDLYSYGDGKEIIYSDSENEILYFDIANRYYREDVEIVSDVNGFAVWTEVKNKRLNKHWFSYKNYNKMGSFNKNEGEFTYVDTEEAKKVMSEWKDRYIDEYYDENGYYDILYKGENSLYITAKVYKGMFIPTAVYKDNVKVIEIATK